MCGRREEEKRCLDARSSFQKRYDALAAGPCSLLVGASEAAAGRSFESKDPHWHGDELVFGLAAVAFRGTWSLFPVVSAMYSPFDREYFGDEQ